MLARGGTLLWCGRAHGLRPDSLWRERYTLLDSARKLATIDGKGWGGRPVSLELYDERPIEPGLVLFAAFVVRALAEDATSAASGAAAADAVACG